MIFGSIPILDAVGAILAHRAGEFRKGRVLSAEDVAALAALGVREVMAARLEQRDMAENDAASRIARSSAGANVRVGAAFTGRANLYALQPGLTLIDAAKVDALNALDESITLATLAPFSRTAPRQMLATIKVIPFATPKACVEAAERIGEIVRVAPFRPMKAALVSTLLSGMKPALLDKNRKALEARLRSIGSEIALERRVAHDTAALARAIGEAKGADPILIFGASAITDRRDVVPAAITAAGGTIDAFGMPVDPGNLLLTARLGGATVVGLPGCARSPKLNGFDFVLWRIAAGLPVGRGEIAAMGVGGLLGEIATRPQPRDVAMPRIGAVVLAAGQSSRMGSNKLLEPVAGKPMIRHAVEAAVASAAEPVIVVTGNDGERVRNTLDGLPVQFIDNPDFSNGLSTSLKHGMSVLPGDCDGAIVLLGDMPGVTGALIDTLIAAFDPSEDRAICIATRGGRRGNPVLWARRFFPEIARLEGDAGAKSLIARHPDLVCEVEAEDDAPLTDIDTPEALEAYRRR